MIASISGVLASRDGDQLVLQTAGGVGYTITVPLGVAGRLPPIGTQLTLHTELVVREDHWALYGFDQPSERAVFQRLLGASGFGPKLALALLSTLGPQQTIRGIVRKDITALSQVSGIGKKKAERLVLELHDKFTELPLDGVRPATASSDEAVVALIGLGYTPATAEPAVRAARQSGPDDSTADVIRRALQTLVSTRPGR